VVFKTAQNPLHLPRHSLPQDYEGLAFGFTLDGLYDNCNPNPRNESHKLGKKIFSERSGDKIDVTIGENTLRVNGGMRKRLAFIKPIEQDDFGECACDCC
jgi:hypothetical protein